jgi:anhydro-N-acetylmuramic acid kinase
LLLAFDTGPGNALINDWLLCCKGLAYDPEGACAAAGHVHADLLASCLANPALALRPPRSFDRDTFKLDAQQQTLLNGLSPEDGAATLTAFTAQTIADAAKFLPDVPQSWFVTGGGRHNTTLMQKLDAALRHDDPQCQVEPLEALGFDVDACEAYAFAFLAARGVLGLPISFPGTTRAPHPLSGGKLAYPGI